MNMTEQSDIAFREEQRPRRWLVWLFMVCFAVLAVANVAGLLVPGLMREEGTPPSSGQIWRAVLAIAVFATWLAYVYLPRLTTEVRRGGLYVRFFPRHWSFRRIPLDNVT